MKFTDGSGDTDARDKEIHSLATLAGAECLSVAFAHGMGMDPTVALSGVIKAREHLDKLEAALNDTSPAFHKQLVGSVAGLPAEPFSESDGPMP